MQNGVPVDNEQKKRIHIEVLRIVGITFVAFNHTNTMGFVHFVWHETGSFLFWLNMFFSVFCKFGAAIFFMISGAMLLNKPQRSIRTVFRTKIKRYMLILLSFSLFYAVTNYIFLGTNYTVLSFLQLLYSSSIKYHLWFLYTYIAFLIIMPVLQSWCKNMEDKHFVYIIIIHFVFQLLSVIQYLCFNGKIAINSYIIPTLPINIVVLPLLGYYLEHRAKITSGFKQLGLLWMVNICCIILCCYATYVKGMQSGGFSEDNSQTFFSTLSFVNCITIYLTIKYIFGKIRLSESTRKRIISIGSLCFGIYLFHPVIKDLPFFRPFIDYLLVSSVPHFFIMIIYILCMIIPAGVLSFCIRKITKVI